MANKKSQKNIRIVLPAGQKTLFSEGDLPKVSEAVRDIKAAFTEAGAAKDLFAANVKSKSSQMAKDLEAVAKAARDASAAVGGLGAVQSSVAKASKTPSAASGTGGTAGSSSGGQRTPRTAKTTAPAVNPVAAAMSGSGQSSAVEPVASGMSSAGKRSSAEAKAKASKAAKDEAYLQSEIAKEKAESDKKKLQAATDAANALKDQAKREASAREPQRLRDALAASEKRNPSGRSEPSGPSIGGFSGTPSGIQDTVVPLSKKPLRNLVKEKSDKTTKDEAWLQSEITKEQAATDAARLKAANEAAVALKEQARKQAAANEPKRLQQKLFAMESANPSGRPEVKSSIPPVGHGGPSWFRNEEFRGAGSPRDQSGYMKAGWQPAMGMGGKPQETSQAELMRRRLAEMEYAEPSTGRSGVQADLEASQISSEKAAEQAAHKARIDAAKAEEKRYRDKLKEIQNRTRESVLGKDFDDAQAARNDVEAFRLSESLEKAKRDAAQPGPGNAKAVDKWSSRLDYRDVTGQVTDDANEPSRRKYAAALAKSDPKAIEELSKKLRKSFAEEAKKSGVEPSMYGKSESWSLWDIGKQLHMNENPQESNANYRLGNPVTDEQVQKDIVARHLEWEATDAKQGGQTPSHILASEGRRRIDSRPSSRFGDRQEAFDDAVNKIHKGRGLYEVSQSLTSTHVEAAFDDADVLIGKDIDDAGDRQKKAQADIVAAKASGNADALKAAQEQWKIAKEDLRTLNLRRDQNRQFAKKVRVSDKNYENALEARNKALEAVDAATNPFSKKKAEFDLQAKQKKLDQAHREKQAVRNPNAASKGFGGQNLTFAAQQAAYGVEDFFQVLAAGQSPVRAFLGAANNIGPALALVGVSSVAASVGVAGLLAATAIFATKGRTAKKQAEDLRKAFDALADSAAKIEKIKISLASGDSLTGVAEALRDITKELIAVNAQVEHSRDLSYESRREAFAPKRSEDATLGRGTRVVSRGMEEFEKTWRRIKLEAGNVTEGFGTGFNDVRKQSGERYQGPKSIENIKAENPQLQGGAIKSYLKSIALAMPVGTGAAMYGINKLPGGWKNQERVAERLEKIQAEFDRNKELGVYEQMQSLLKTLDDQMKQRAEVLKKTLSARNFTSESYDFASGLESQFGASGLRSGAVQSAQGSRIQIEKDIRDAEEAAKELLPAYEKKLKELEADIEKLSFSSLVDAEMKRDKNLTKDDAKILASQQIATSRQLALDRKRATEDQKSLIEGNPEALRRVRDKQTKDFNAALGKAGFGLRNFNQMLPGVVNEGLFRLDDIKQSRGALKESFNASSAGDQQTILKQLDNAARPRGTAQVMGVEGLYNTIQTSLLNNDPSLEVEKQIRDEIKALRDDLARGAKVPGRAMGGMIRGYAEGGRSDARDTIPARLRPGEVVLTPQQQERLGKNSGRRSAEMFGEAGVPGFAGGGGFGFGFNSQLSQIPSRLWPSQNQQQLIPQATPAAPVPPVSANHPQSRAFGTGPTISPSATPPRSSSSKPLTPFQQRAAMIKAAATRRKEAQAQKTADKKRDERRNAFMGPIYSTQYHDKLAQRGEEARQKREEAEASRREKILKKRPDADFDFVRRSDAVPELSADRQQQMRSGYQMRKHQMLGSGSEQAKSSMGESAFRSESVGKIRDAKLFGKQAMENSKNSKSESYREQHASTAKSYFESAKKEELDEMKRRGMSEKAIEAKRVSQTKAEPLSKEESDAKRAEMLARKNSSDATESAAEKKTPEAKTDWRSGGNNPIPRLGNTSADIARSMRTGKPDGEGTTPWSFGSLKSGIAPRIDYGKSSGTTTKGKTRTNSWMDKATPESSSEASNLTEKNTKGESTGRYKKGTAQRAGQTEERLAGIYQKEKESEKTPNRFVKGGDPGARWRAGVADDKSMEQEGSKLAMDAWKKKFDSMPQDIGKFADDRMKGIGVNQGTGAMLKDAKRGAGFKNKQMPLDEEGMPIRKEKSLDDLMDRKVGGIGDVSSKGMEVSLKDGLDNSKVLTDILRTLTEKLGMIATTGQQTVGAIQNMETGGLI